MNTPELREACAQALLAAESRARTLRVFAGFDGFVDEILHAVDKRQDATHFDRVPTIAKFAERIAAAAGRSTNVELVNVKTKLGGNGPILANALASFGLKVTYLGALGYPTLHPVFASFAQRAEVISIADPGHTDAFEFEDGKLLMGKLMTLNEVNWENIQSRYSRAQFADKFGSSELICFANWTMLPCMSDIWESVQSELCGTLAGPKRQMFFDLADPEKRTPTDIARALDLIAKFEKHFDVILGLNEKESGELSIVLGIPVRPRTPEGQSEAAVEIRKRVPVSSVVIHPVKYALAVGAAGVSLVEGPFVAKPMITTGAGDHFNAGFCLGKMLGLDNAMSVLTGVATSGFYVRTARSPGVAELAAMMRDWPAE